MQQPESVSKGGAARDCLDGSYSERINSAVRSRVWVVIALCAVVVEDGAVGFGLVVRGDVCPVATVVAGDVVFPLGEAAEGGADE